MSVSPAFPGTCTESGKSTNWPGAGELGIIAASALGMFVIGGLVFRQLKRGFADVL